MRHPDRRAGGASRTIATTALLTLTFGIVACSEPGLPETAAPQEAPEDVLAGEVPDPALAELSLHVDALTRTVTEARDQLELAATSTSASETRAAASAALVLLLDDPDAASDGPPGLFPTRSGDRTQASQDDLLTSTLNAARTTGGSFGRAAVETLRDPVAGDLGAWERDAQGVTDSAASVVAGAGDVDAVAEAVLDIPGDGVRALAWTFLAERSNDPELARAAAERGRGHLSVVLVGLEILRAGAPDPPDADTA